MSAGATERRVALKVDCDTFEGTRRGLPNLLRLFDRLHVRASFFFTLGPDYSGRAIARVFTRPGFLGKMLRSNAVALYGPKTMLYGTLLPAPRIGKRLAAEIRAVGDAGHEVGVHAWDHVRWHDRLDRMSEAEVEQDYGAAHATFAEIFGRPARASAAPGWHATATSLAVQKRHDLLYASDTRLGPPFFPEAGGQRFRTLEIPTTLATWDEALSAPGRRDSEALIASYVRAVRGTEVHSIHTEVEGTAHLDLFRRQLEAWLADGVRCVPLEEIAQEMLAAPSRIAVRRLVRTTLPNRAGLVTSSVTVE
jgi:peptidoglycan/xylan/chitin deacetylase (PgdA/CDA1 family)